MNRNIYLRPAVPRDADALHELRMYLWRNSIQQVTDEEPKKEDTTKAILNPREALGLCLLAVSEDEKVANAMRGRKETNEVYGLKAVFNYNQNKEPPPEAFQELEHREPSQCQPLRFPGVLLGAVLVLPFKGSRPNSDKTCHLILFMPSYEIAGGMESWVCIAKTLVKDAFFRMESRCHNYLSMVTEMSCGSEPSVAMYACFIEEQFKDEGSIVNACQRTFEDGTSELFDRKTLQKLFDSDRLVAVQDEYYGGKDRSTKGLESWLTGTYSILKHY